MNERISQDVYAFYSTLLAELYKKKSASLEKNRLVDFNIDIVKLEKKIAKKKGTFKNDQDVEFMVDKEVYCEYLNKYKNTLSKRKLRKRGKKLFILEKKLEKGYIAGVRDCIKIVENIFGVMNEEE